MRDLSLPNLLTALGLVCGLCAIFAANQSLLPLAGSLVVAALLLDRLDGMAARWLGQTSEIGAQLDSLADLVSFGIAPVFLVVARLEGWASMVAGTVYAVCAAWRLARFHHVGMVDSALGPAFVGVPVPAAAAWLLLLVALVPDGAAFIVLPASLLVAAGTMLSPIRYPKNGVVLVLTVVGLVVALVGLWGWHDHA